MANTYGVVHAFHTMVDGVKTYITRDNQHLVADLPDKERKDLVRRGLVTEAPAPTKTVRALAEDAGASDIIGSAPITPARAAASEVVSQTIAEEGTKATARAATAAKAKA